MTMAKATNSYAALSGFVLLMLWTVLFSITAHAGAPDVKQRAFAAPEEATKALAEAVQAKDQAALGAIFGAGYEKLLSGDPTEDSRELEQFAAALEKSSALVKAGDDKFTLTIGDDRWPFPIPLVKKDGQWLFDTQAGMQEILNRRVGENELSAISTCRAYVLAQWEYFTEGDHDNDGVAEYAQHFISAPGQKDGLYWDTAPDEKPSPMGALVASARAEGYSAGQGRVRTASQAQTPASQAQTGPRHPFHGYYFKILKAQGPHAPGGKYGYIINGNMIAGYALIAYPDKWGSSGVMTFIVNQQGRVYQRNLGPNTLKIAGTITEYDPDPGWQPVKE